MSELKVFGGLVHKGGKQVRTIVAARSRAGAARIIGRAYHRDFWSETGNEVELAVALGKPGTVFQADSSMPVFKQSEFVEVSKA